jgi:predicted nucleotidyltransferase
MTSEIKEKSEMLAILCEKYNVVRLDLFGSAVNNVLSSAGDIDFLINFGEIR